VNGYYTTPAAAAVPAGNAVTDEAGAKSLVVSLLSLLKICTHY